MDEPERDEQEQSELDGLRRRAYGRGAGPALDAPGWARLRLLEERAAPTAVSRPADRTAEPEPMPPVESASAEPTSAESASAEPTTTPPAAVPVRSGMLLAVLWALSLVATAVLAGLTTAWATSSTARDTAVLPLSASDRWTGSGFADVVATEDFYGLTFLRSSGGGPPDDLDLCLVAVPTETSGGGLVINGCSAGSFPAVAQTTVRAGMPEPLVTEFGEGTGLRFTLDGDTVRVRRD
ncbi:hypothetical protein HQQ82_01425 [Rathayibacter sp. VKM Ac-2856]|uniref:hypothetical protein n=1 Tax=unclassified Rathayibacter TaxID=2609250 RepID=UPI0015636394|nr:MULTISPECIES: hypothetical protein [unclassified Rathayibacter]NQX03455.1 hypothetical protein [Rathayibacter sp. VKM Ac-2858]NQX18623.1 hypothetical protein [Rathayibacter sp. VKM Ac-2856]